MRSAAIVHDELEKYLTQSACFNYDDMIKISTTHLSNNQEIKNILKKKIITKKDIKILTKYPTGLMFLEIGGKITYKDKQMLFVNDYQKSCWDSSENKPHIELSSIYDEDWHLHPWNIVGYGKPNFFSREDIEDAFTNYKIKYLVVGHPFNYSWPTIFSLDAKNNNIKGKIVLFELVSILERGTPFIDPQIDWTKWNNILNKYNVSLKVE